MVIGGMTQRCASEKLGVNICTIRQWLARHKTGGSLENKHGRGRKSKLTKVAKIVIAKSISKKHQSTRKLAKRLRSKGFAVSHTTVRNYFRGTLKVIPFKPQKQPKLTEKQRTACLNFVEIEKLGKKKIGIEYCFQTNHPLGHIHILIIKMIVSVLRTDLRFYPLKQ